MNSTNRRTGMLNGKLEWDVSPQGHLVIRADDQARQDIEDEGYDESDLGEVLEDVTSNGLQNVDPNEIGALTDAPILTDGERYWWYPQYETQSIVLELLSNGLVIFQKADVESTNESIVEDADNSKLLFSQEKAEAFFTELRELSQYSERTRELFEKIQNIYLELEKEIKSEITSKNRKEEDAFDMKRESVSESKTDMRSFMSIVTESDFQQVKGIKNTVKTTDAMKEKGGKKSNDLMKKV